MTEHAKLVIIGAGIVGCATAYHAARMGWDDIIVLEEGPLFQRGSTSHAPGLVFQTNYSRTMTKFAQYTVDFLSGLRMGDQSCFYSVGGLEVAYTRDRLEELKRKCGAALSWGVDARLISPEETQKMIPIIDSSKILGAYFVPTDGLAKAVRACEVMASEGEAKGVRFHGDTRVTGIEAGEGRVRAVTTQRGRITAENVLLCAGIWGPPLARSAGLTLPLSPMEHLYAKTAPLPELAGESQEVVHPILRHQDRAMYFRQHADSYGIGSYLHPPLLVDDEEIRSQDARRVTSALREFTPGHFERARQEAGELLPPLRDAELSYKINGIFSFTVDGMPILGESRDIAGLWVAEAVWITHSCGVAKAVAEWMVDGMPSLDLRECDVNRFHAYASSPSYIRERTAQQYREVYDIIHPLQQMKSPRSLRLSPFHLRMEELGGVFFENAGWERPQWYDANERLLEGRDWPVRSGWEGRFWSPAQGAEHHATREAAAVYDLTPFTKIEVRGPGATEYLQRLCANQVEQPVGKVVYTSMLNRRGGIVCDLTVTRLAADRFLVVTGGSTGMRDLAWMQRSLPAVSGSVQLSDISSSLCCIGLWGPKAQALLAKLTDEDLSSSAFGSFTAKRIMAENVPTLALRVSYVGEAGWELYSETGYGPALWDTLWRAGREFGLIAGGGAAFDSLRLEKGYRLWGSDIHTEYNPFEAGLGFAVKLEKGEFTGREALIRVKEKGITRKLSRMHFDEPGRVVMGKEPILKDGKVSGYVTSSNYGYTLGKGIAFGYLPVDDAQDGTQVEVQYFGVRHPATVVRER